MFVVSSEPSNSRWNWMFLRSLDQARQQNCIYQPTTPLFSSIGYLSWFLWCSTIDFTFTTLQHFFKTSFVRLQNVMCVLNARSYTLQQQSAQEKSFANSNKNCNVRHKSHNTRETMLGVYQCVTSFAICFSPLAHLQSKCLWSMSNGSSECCG